MLSALKNTPMISKELEMAEETTVPSMRLKKLRFACVSSY